MEDKTVALQIPRRLLLFLLICYILFALYFLYLSPMAGRVQRDRVPNLIPFKTILEQIQGERGPDYLLFNLLGNVGLLFPVGLLSRLLSRRKARSWLAVLMAGFLLSFLVEALQGILRLGYFDVDDILLNGLGYFFAVLLARSFLVLPGEKPIHE